MQMSSVRYRGTLLLDLLSFLLYEVGYEICKIMHEHLKEGMEMFKPFGQFIKMNLIVDFGIPYHAGAEKHCREVGLLGK